MKPIAHIYTNLTSKFGVPRQSGVIPELCGTIVFEPKYRVPEAFRGLGDFSHIWILWEFSEAKPENIDPENEDDEPFSPTVRPPRLGGNKRMGVFATRSPYRPNHIGLSVVKIEGISLSTPDGPTIKVSGVDMMNGTPIYDIKPYIPYSDSIPHATSGFTTNLSEGRLKVNFPAELLNKIFKDEVLFQTSSTFDSSNSPFSPFSAASSGAYSASSPVAASTATSAKVKELMDILSHDARPQYQDDPERMYGITYLNYDIRFKISGDTLTVVEVNQTA